MDVERVFQLRHLADKVIKVIVNSTCLQLRPTSVDNL